MLMESWCLTDLSSDGKVYTFGRNPYFWRVDTEGNQLPYIDALDVEIVEDNDFYQYGDASKFKRIVYQGDQIGNMFITRMGKRVYFVVVSGAYFDDAELWCSLMGPRLVAFESYQP